MPGSALKPFVFAAGLEAGWLRPDSVLRDAPLELADWRPSNMDGSWSGEVTATEALRRSLNLPALRVARRAGIARCAGILEAVGLDLGGGALSRSGLSLVTGGVEVRLLDLTNAYATLARGGEHLELRLYEDERREAPLRVLRPETCAALWAMLTSEQRSPFGSPAGGSHAFAWKTGTSSGHRDAWAVGHDRALAIGVWVGRFSGAGHPELVGSRVAEPLLARLFASPVLRQATL